MGREKAGALREVAGREGWLEPSSALPDDATLAQVLQVPSSWRNNIARVGFRIAILTDNRPG